MLTSTAAVDLASRRDCTLSSICVHFYSCFSTSFFFLTLPSTAFFFLIFSFFPCHGAFFLIVTRSLIGVVPEAIERLTARSRKQLSTASTRSLNLEKALINDLNYNQTTRKSPIFSPQHSESRAILLNR